jgi:hypothetical protein
MILRYTAIEALQLLARPGYWISLVVISVLVLVGLDQLALDSSLLKILIVDNEAKQLQGERIKSLVRELSGIDPVLATPRGDLETLIDETNADIIISNAAGRWQASLRPRSVLDHRRLARVGFTMAAIVNRLSPWETIISADAVAPMDYGTTACELGARICSVYRDVGDPRFEALCIDPSKYVSTDEYKFDDIKPKVCPQTGGEVLRDSLGFDFQLRKFCQPDLVDAGKTRGICKSKDSPSLESIVSLFSDPQTHTRVFVPRTICLLAVFIAFIVSCRSWMQETHNRSLIVAASITHGRIVTLIIAKLIVTLSFSLLLVVVLLEISHFHFDMSIKPGLFMMLVTVAIGSLSSAMLGLVVALIVKNEVAAYAVGSLYLLVLFILSGYIDDLKEGSSLFAVFSYVLPLKYMIAPFTSWMLLGTTASLYKAVPASLLSQCLGSLTLMLCAIEYHRRST